MVTVSELTAPDYPAWDNYVRNATHGLPQHLSGWREVLYKTHGYETPYLFAQEGAQVVGVMPLFLVRSVLLGNRATTMPGGLCADTAEVAAALMAHGQQIAHQSKSKCLTLHDTRQVWPLDLPTSSHHVYWLVSLPANVEAMWEGLASNIRRQVRIARRNGLTVTLDRTGRELATFYDVFSRFTHQSGTPVFGRNFLEHVIEAFPDDFNIAVVYQARQPIGAYFQLQLGQTMYGVWGASLRDYLALRPAYLAYWEILSQACLSSFRYLDMGRSPTASNAAHYKKQWGGIPHPIYQQVLSFGEQPAAAIAGSVQANSKMQMMRRLWPKLPLPLAQYLGPKLRRHVPFS